MAYAAGWKANLYLSGTSTTLSNAATTVRPGTATANTEYRITNAAQRVLNPAVAVTVEVDPDGLSGYSVASASSYTLNSLDGTVIFAVDQGVDALVRVSGAYYPMLAVGALQEVSWAIEKAELEASVIGEGQFAKYIEGMVNGTVSGSRVEPTSKALASDNTIRLWQRLVDSTHSVLELRPEDSGVVRYRMWADFNSTTDTNSVSDLARGEFTAQSLTKELVGRSERSSIVLVTW